MASVPNGFRWGLDRSVVKLTEYMGKNIDIPIILVAVRDTREHGWMPWCDVTRSVPPSRGIHGIERNSRQPLDTHHSIHLTGNAA